MIHGLLRLLGMAEHIKVDRTWVRNKYIDPDDSLYSDTKEPQPVIKMSFGYYGDIFVTFADGRQTCVWPSGQPVAPYSIRIITGADLAKR